MIKDKNIIITGTSSGIGKKITQILIKKNNVWGCSRTKASLKYKNYFHSKVDLKDPIKVKMWFKKIKNQSKGKIDLLICNAGIMFRSLNLLDNDKNIIETINVNLTSNIILSNLVSNLMIKKKSGLIIFFSSIASDIKQEGSSCYSASKTAIETFSQILSKELYKFNIKIHTLRIIYFSTKMSEGLDKSKLKNILKKYKTNLFSNEHKIINQINKILKNKISKKTIIYDKKR